ncbi:MAG: hypothetical protein JWR42_714 [Marmoricola sp.]|nr:hypothetical protein [Marmoricola sp.]
MAAVGVGVPVVTVLVPLGVWISGGPLAYDLTGVGRASLRAGLHLDHGVSLRGGSTVGVRIEEAGATTWLASLLPGMLLSALAVTVAVLLFRLVQRIQAGTPFVAASASSLRLIGLTLEASTLIMGVGNGIAGSVVHARALTATELRLSFDFSLVPVIAGLLVLALAEAFAQGVRMQDDVEGLV